MKKEIKLFNYTFTFVIGNQVTQRDLENSVRDAILRKSKKDLPWDGSSWFQVIITSMYKYKQIRVLDFSGSLDYSVYENTSENLDELLLEAKKHFDAIK